MNETGYTSGSRAAWLSMLHTCLRELGVDDPVAGQARWVSEREQTVAMLRQVCGRYGDNDWPDTLHLADVVDKHMFDARPDAISSMLDREGLTRGYGRAAINSVAALIGEHAQLRELLKEAHECLRDYRGYIMGQTELSTSVDKLLFRIPNVLEATKPRK